ncbi:MAG: DUF47 family protein [Deltaproteobacteria bacterium]|nr:DUF47 family protein [Deltaproteobacteria bacterium]
MSFLSSFMKPKQDNFVKYLVEQAELDVKGLEELVAYMKEGNPEHAEKVNKTEKAADEVRRLLVDELNRTFVTPFDREDIYSLSRAIDDIIDYAHTTVEEMAVLTVAPDAHLLRMAQILLEGAIEIHHAMQRIVTHPGVANDHTRRAKSAENQMEKAYRTALADLFNGPADGANIICMMKKREIYRHLSNAADRADEAANVISDIVVKMT